MTTNFNEIFENEHKRRRIVLKWHQLIINRPLKNSNMKLVNKIFHSSLFDDHILRSIRKIIKILKLQFLFAALIAVAAAGTYKSHPAIAIVRQSDVRNGVASSHWK